MLVRNHLCGVMGLAMSNPVFIESLHDAWDVSYCMCCVWFSKKESTWYKGHIQSEV